MIEARNITVSRGTKDILSGVSVQLNPSELLCILGPNGAGKSTLLKVISGEIAPNAGKVFLNGRGLQSYRPVELAARRGVLSQHTELAFSFTVAEVVSLANLDARRDPKLEHWALDQVGLTDKFEQPFLTLSGGEKQRVHLARVFLQLRTHPVLGETQFLILDEPTANLDLAFQRQILELARSAAGRGMGVLAVLHDLNEAMRYGDRVAIMNRGTIAAQGRPRDVITAAMVEQVYGVHVEVIDRPQQASPLVAVI